MGLLGWQRDAMRALREGSPSVILASLPKGSGKSWVAARAVKNYMDPRGPLHAPGKETVVVAASLAQGLPVFDQSLAMMKDLPLRTIRNTHEIRARNDALDVQLRIAPHSVASAQGLGASQRLIIADECSAWSETAGKKVFDQLNGSVGKPNQLCQLFLISTIAPSVGWWRDLVLDPPDTWLTFVLQGREFSWPEVIRVNPLVKRFPETRKELRSKFTYAKRNAAAESTFRRDQLNMVEQAEDSVTFTAREWATILAKPEPEQSGMAVCGLDMSRGRSWSCAAGIWESGLVRVRAFGAGVPDIAKQERRDHQRPGVYAKLVRDGSLILHPDRRTPDFDGMEELVAGWNPIMAAGDRFLKDAALDVIGDCPFEERTKRWSTASEDVDALRTFFLDGPGALDEASKRILTHALSQSKLTTDPDGFRRIDKTHPIRARNDALISACMAAGSWHRHLREAVPEPMEAFLI